MRFRIATIKDLDSVVTLIRFNRHKDAVHVIKALIRSRLIFIATDKKICVGLIALCSHRHMRFYRRFKKQKMFLDLITIHKNYRGIGIADKLFKLIKSRFKSLIAIAYKKNVIRCLHRLGFSTFKQNRLSMYLRFNIF